jgi:hypothetical protein
MFSINRSDVVGAFESPKGMSVNCHSTTHHECSLLFVILLQIHLPITALQVQSGELFGSSQRVQSVINPGQWETIFLHDMVPFPVMYTEAQDPILLDCVIAKSLKDLCYEIHI